VLACETHQLEIIVLRCDPIDAPAVPLRLEIGKVPTWTVASSLEPLSNLDRLIQPIDSASTNSGTQVWVDYLSALACLEQMEQQIVYDRLRSLYFKEFERPTRIYILQTDLTPIPSALGFLVSERIVELPSGGEIYELLGKYALPQDDRLIRLSMGLSHADLEGCLRKIDPLRDPYAQIEQFRSKRLALKGIRYEPPPQHIEIGGLDLLVRWIEDLQYRLSSAAEAIGLPYPKGVMLAGVPGTGKTFSARAISAILGYPLFALSIDYVIEGGGLALPKLLTTIESCAPCILFVDEIEKLFGAGIDRRILATFLTWLNDKLAKVFVIGTLNRMAEVPIEMTRSGRFDRIFFIDSPDEGQRVELFRLFLKRYDKRFANEDDSVFSPQEWQHLADSSIEFIGAEIQQVAQDTIALVHRERQTLTVTIDDLIKTTLAFKSMYKRDKKKIHEIRNMLVDKADPASSGSRKFLPDRHLNAYAPIPNRN
jgi:ATPase family associated with various cellular activities (AAA)